MTEDQPNYIDKVKKTLNKMSEKLMEFSEEEIDKFLDEWENEDFHPNEELDKFLEDYNSRYPEE